MEFRNTTALDSARLRGMMERAIAGWPDDRIDVHVRYSRGAEFSGSCYYESGRIHINLGRHNRYPYLLQTVIARPKSNGRYWWRDLYSVELADACELALFVFLHEFYHWLVKLSRRNVRQKEGRCDRFAARVLVDQYAAAVRDAKGRLVAREDWDFQDLDGFVAAARRCTRRVRSVPQAKAGRPGPRPAAKLGPGEQLVLFEC